MIIYERQCLDMGKAVHDPHDGAFTKIITNSLLHILSISFLYSPYLYTGKIITLHLN